MATQSTNWPLLGIGLLGAVGIYFLTRNNVPFAVSDRVAFVPDPDRRGFVQGVLNTEDQGWVVNVLWDDGIFTQGLQARFLMKI